MSTHRSHCVPTLVLGSSSFDRRSAGKSALFPFPFPFPFLFSIFFFRFLLSFPTNSFISLFFSFFFFLFCFSFLLPNEFFFFVPLSFHFLILFFSFSLFSWKFLVSFWSILDHSVKGGNFLPFSFNPLVWCLIFSLFLLFLISFFIAPSHTWLNVSHGIMPHMWLNVSHSFLVDHMDLAKCHSLRVPCGVPLIILPCVIRHHTPRKMCNFDCLEIQKNSTILEFEKIRRGS